MFDLGTLRMVIAIAGSALCILDSESVRAQSSYTYKLPYEVTVIYPNNSWLPAPYQQFYDAMTIEDVIELFTKDSLQRDGISFESVEVISDAPNSSDFVVTINSEDGNASLYETVHPRFVANYQEAAKGILRCIEEQGCWNKNNSNPEEPWAFFPQVGLPMAMQRSVLMLNYPPSTALIEKNYLNTFTMTRWTRVLEKVGIRNPTLYETIVDIRPIAAPGSGTSENLPDAQTYFNDPTGSTGGYYINPQLSLMLNPQWSGSDDRTLPLVVLGTPARDEWNKITGVGEGVLSTGTAKIPGGGKSTPYILGNHPDVTTYQCCPNDPNSECDGSRDLVPNEEIDVQIACWVQAMSTNPDGDPERVLSDCRHKWVTDRSTDDDLTFCALARMDSNECFEQEIDWQVAVDYCKSNNNDPCATYRCPVPARW